MPVPAKPTHQLRIRVGIPNDAAVIAEVSARFFARTFGPDNNPTQLAAYLKSSFSEELQRRELEDPACTYLLLDVDGSLGAFALLRHNTTNPSVQGDAPVELQRFYVDHDFHGSGVAAQFMDACVETAQSRGGRTLWLCVWEQNPRAIRFYEKRGFADVGRTVFHMGSDVQHDRVMARSIEPLHTDSVRNARTIGRLNAL